MSLWDTLTGRLTAPKLTRRRIALALLVALAADGLQIPFVIPPAPEIIDVVAMLLTVWLLGFHVLLLPTFVVELVPVVGMLPTWTACVGAVIALRKRAEAGMVATRDSTTQLSPAPSPTAELPTTNPPPASQTSVDVPPPDSLSNPS